MDPHCPIYIISHITRMKEFFKEMNVQFFDRITIPEELYHVIHPPISKESPSIFNPNPEPLSGHLTTTRILVHAYDKDFRKLDIVGTYWAGMKSVPAQPTTDVVYIYYLYFEGSELVAKGVFYDT